MKNKHDSAVMANGRERKRKASEQRLVQPPTKQQAVESYNTNDSSSLTNEKDHHYFLNSADVCW